MRINKKRRSYKEKNKIKRQTGSNVDLPRRLQNKISKIKSVSSSITFQSVKKSLMILQKNVVQESNNTNKRLSISIDVQSKNRLFSKLGYVSFTRKLKILMEQVKKREINKTKISMYKWLMTIFKSSNPHLFLDFYTTMFKKKLLINLHRILQSQSKSKSSKVQSSEKHLQWLYQFSSQFDLFQPEPNLQRQSKAKLKSEQIDDKNEEPAVLNLRIERPVCPKLNCGCLLVDRKCRQGNHLLVICDSCSWSSHKCHKQQTIPAKVRFVNSILITASGQELNKFTLHPMPRLQNRQQNNILQILSLCHYKPIIGQRMFPTVPKHIKCSYPIIVGEAAKQIMNNRREQKYLALNIKQSSVENAGLGVYVTRKILTANALVCSYLGEIGMGSRIPVSKYKKGKHLINDSIFTIGWLDREIMIMAPNVYSNVGRFINYNSPERCNLKSNLCLVKIATGQYQFSVFLSTTRPIEAGEELFYNYGPEYCNHQ